MVRGVLFFLLLISSVTAVSADVFKYVDKDGKSHYVTSTDDIPFEYHDQISAPHNLPLINKFDFKNTPKSKRKPAASNAQVELLVTSWCHYCRKAENFMKANGVRYRKYDIEKSSIGRRKHQELGGGGVPVIKIGKTVVRGFNESYLRSLLNIR